MSLLGTEISARSPLSKAMHNRSLNLFAGSRLGLFEWNMIGRRDNACIFEMMLSKTL